MLNVLGLIPARSGSIEVPGKNIRDLAGKPLIAHTIEAAKQSKLSRIIVSTDSNAYAELAKKYGAETPFLRPQDISGRDAHAIQVVRHALEFLKRVENWTPDAVFYLQPTSPFRTAIHINQAIGMMEDKEAIDSVMSVTKVVEHPAYMWIKNGLRMVVAFEKLERPQSRQHLKPFYMDNNAIILSRTSYLNSQHDAEASVVNYNNFEAMEIDGLIGVDIDNEMQFKVANILMKDMLNM